MSKHGTKAWSGRGVAPSISSMLGLDTRATEPDEKPEAAPPPPEQDSDPNEVEVETSEPEPGTEATWPPPFVPGREMLCTPDPKPDHEPSKFVVGVIPPPAPPKPEPHACYRCRGAAGQPVYCTFCLALFPGATINVRVADMLTRPPHGVSGLAWHRCVHAILQMCPTHTNPSAMSSYIDQQGPMVNTVLSSLFPKEG